MTNKNHDKKGRFTPTLPMPKTAELKRAFLERYATVGTILHACEGIVAYKTVELWRHDDPDFEAQFAVAAHQYVAKLEQEADRRGVEGISKGIYYKGEKVDVEREYSDTLLIFRLKRLDPAYRERTEISGPGGGPIVIREVEVRLTGP